jgi:hypothetical protein
MGTPDRTTIAARGRNRREQQNCHEIAMKTTYMHTTTLKAFLRMSATRKKEGAFELLSGTKNVSRKGERRNFATRGDLDKLSG